MTRGPWLFAILVIVALAASLVPPAAQLAWHMAGHSGILPESFAAGPAPGSADPDPVGTDNILALAPFGTVDAPPPRAAEAEAGRRVDIDLHGVLLASDPALSRALIAVSGGIDRYRIGDDLAQGVRLTAILSDVIEVEVDGTARRIGFDGVLDGAAGGAGGAGTGIAAPDGTDDAPQAAASPLDRLRAAIVPGRGSLDLREAPPPETTQDYIDLWRARIIDDPQSVLDTIGLVPGEQGYRIAENPNIGVTLAGLRPGDVVTKVNGQDVGNPEQDRTFYDEIAASGQARLEVVRDGATLLMSFPLR